MIRFALILHLVLIAQFLTAQVQPDTVFRATANYVTHTGSGGTYDVTLLVNDLRGSGNIGDLAAGDLFFDAECGLFTVTAIPSPSGGPQGVVTVTVTGTTTPAPGLGALVRPGVSGFLGWVQEASERVNTCISQYNTTIALSSNGRVEKVNTIADTLIAFPNPQESDIVVRQDGTAAAFYNGVQWLILTGGGGGGGSPDDWGSQVVVSDNTMTGDGTAGDPLAVNTSVIATQNYVNDELDDRIERTFEVEAILSTSTIALPTQVDTRYPVLIFRGVAKNSVAFSGTSADWTISGTTATSNYRPLKVGELVTIIYTQLQ